jgi:transposase
MARHILLEPHLTIEELERRYRSTKDPVERSRWHFLWLLARRLTAKVIASITGYSAYWIGRIARRYNEHGPTGVKDLRHQPRPSTPLLTASQQDELVAALAAGGAPGSDHWSGQTVAAWISQRVGRQLGWAYLRRLGARLRVPRPRHVQADPQAQADFKQHLRPLLRDVATAFPQATVELWAVEIVCTQMTKTDLCACWRGRDDIADLHLVIHHDDTAYEEFDELALLLKRGRSQAVAHVLAELLHPCDQRGGLLVALCVHGQLRLLLCQRLLLLRKIAPPSLVLCQRDHAVQVGLSQALLLVRQTALAFAQILLASLQFLG